MWRFIFLIIMTCATATAAGLADMAATGQYPGPRVLWLAIGIGFGVMLGMGMADRARATKDQT